MEFDEQPSIMARQSNGRDTTLKMLEVTVRICLALPINVAGQRSGFLDRLITYRREFEPRTCERYVVATSTWYILGKQIATKIMYPATKISTYIQKVQEEL